MTTMDEVAVLRLLSKIEQHTGRRYPALQNVLQQHSGDRELLRELVLLERGIDESVTHAKNRFGFPGR